eukprot:15053539-Heterocapsa_arctica.AAC.1
MASRVVFWAFSALISRFASVTATAASVAPMATDLSSTLERRSAAISACSAWASTPARRRLT